VCAAVTLAGSVAACGHSTFDLHGQVALKRLLSRPDHDGGCRGVRAYGDLGAGRRVSVYDETGKQVATGTLEQGMYSGDRCVFPITVLAVPDGSTSYTVAVGEDRGKLTYSAEQAKNGEVSLTLG